MAISERAPQSSGAGGRTTGAARAVVGASVMVLALGLGTGVAIALIDQLGIGGFSAQLLPAVLCSAIAVPLILVLRKWGDRGSLAGIGLTPLRESTRAFLLGVTVTAGSAAVVFGLGTAAGWVRWGPLDLAALLTFVLANGLVALLLEALPEELTLRGYAWSALRERHRAAIATLGTTALFLIVPGASTVVYAAVAAVLGSVAFPIGIVPAGEDPFAYLVLLTVFGLTLIAARTATPSGSLWTCIGTHLAFLTINRVTLAGQQRGAGWSAELATPDVVLLVPVYLVVTALTYLTIAQRRHRRIHHPGR